MPSTFYFLAIPTCRQYHVWELCNCGQIFELLEEDRDSGMLLLYFFCGPQAEVTTGNYLLPIVKAFWRKVVVLKVQKIVLPITESTIWCGSLPEQVKMNRVSLKHVALTVAFLSNYLTVATSAIVLFSKLCLKSQYLLLILEAIISRRLRNSIIPFPKLIHCMHW